MYLLEKHRTLRFEQKYIGIGCPNQISKSAKKASLEQWKSRLNSLPPAKQSEIAKRYYGGKMS
jgi:hypothetical protein